MFSAKARLERKEEDDEKDEKEDEEKDEKEDEVKDEDEEEECVAFMTLPFFSL